MLNARPKNLQPEKIFLQALSAEKTQELPFWLMRQAGRYLPEYRELRARKSGFLNLVMDPVAACEVTMQPLRRFGMSAAILFSDILVVPMALGQRLEFVEGEGPKLEPVRDAKAVEKLDYVGSRAVLEPVYETVSNVRSALKNEGFEQSALIGFAGAPWTVVAYMVEGSGSSEFSEAKKMMREQPEIFSRLMDKITDATIDYLSRQVQAGAEALQIFDSWAGLLNADEFEKFVIAPTKKITEMIHVKHPGIKIIGFPRGAGKLYDVYAAKAGIDALGLDQHVDLNHAKTLQKTLPVQGNLDPELLKKGGRDLEYGVNRILETLAGGPFIFNLGHGVDKDTPVEHVARLADLVKAFRR